MPAAYKPEWWQGLSCETVASLGRFQAFQSGWDHCAEHGLVVSGTSPEKKAAAEVAVPPKADWARNSDFEPQGGGSNEAEAAFALHVEEIHHWSR